MVMPGGRSTMISTEVAGMGSSVNGDRVRPAALDICTLPYAAALIDQPCTYKRLSRYDIVSNASQTMIAKTTSRTIVRKRWYLFAATSSFRSDGVRCDLRVKTISV